MNYITLNDGGQIPALGFGVYQIPKEETEAAVLAAIEAGYRHIDTAQVYFNEKEVGQAVAKSPVPREELFITTKIWVQDVTAERARASIQESLDRMGLDYLDLVLIHQPYNDIYATWRVMIAMQQEGKIKHIGVSNFSTEKIVDLALFTGVQPAINQIEINPFHQQKERVATQQAEGVVLEAWAPFAEGRQDFFQNPVLLEIAEKHGKSVAQVTLRFLVDRGLVVLAKSSRLERMRENLDIFDFQLDGDDRAKLEALDQGETLFANHADPERIRWIKDYMIELEK